MTTFDSETPEAKDIIYSLLTLCIGDKFGKKIEHSINIYDGVSTIKDITESTEVNHKLSFFIQQYTSEGLQEDGMKKFVSGITFLGGIVSKVFGVLGLLSTASIDNNKYQTVVYYQRKAFLNSALIEIERIKKLKEKVNEKDLVIEFEYLNFLQKQIIMLTDEIRLNDKADKQEVEEILYNFSKYNTHGVVYKDQRPEYSADSYHCIDYYKLFKDQK